MTTHHLNSVVQQQLIEHISAAADPRWCEALCACVPQIIDLLADLGDQPIDRLSSAVKHLILDNCTARGHGDSMSNPATLERHTQLILAELARLHHGHNAETPPQMFG